MHYLCHEDWLCESSDSMRSVLCDFSKFIRSLASVWEVMTNRFHWAYLYVCRKAIFDLHVSLIPLRLSNRSACFVSWFSNSCFSKVFLDSECMCFCGVTGSSCTLCMLRVSFLALSDCFLWLCRSVILCLCLIPALQYTVLVWFMGGSYWLGSFADNICFSQDVLW
jgi:hypothetical protein